MIQGTTPTIRLTLPFDARWLKKMEVAFVSGSPYKQRVVLTKTITDFPSEKVLIPLTQTETRLMEGLVTIEVRAKTPEGDVIGSRHIPKIMQTIASGVDL